MAIPNFVDTKRFRPADGNERATFRQRWGVPSGAFVVGCVAALKFGHKRLDYLITEVARMRDAGCRIRALPTGDVFLLIAGATTDETDQVERLAAESLPGRSRIMRDVPRSEMPDLYRCMDVFVLPSLFEMMPIAVLEATASGIPVLVHTHPNLAWMIGEGGGCEVSGVGVQVSGRRGECEKDEGGGGGSTGNRQQTAGGLCVDMAADGALAGAVAGLTAEALLDLGRQARLRAEKVFSKDVVIGQYVRYYGEIVRDKEDATGFMTVVCDG